MRLAHLHLSTGSIVSQALYVILDELIDTGAVYRVFSHGAYP